MKKQILKTVVCGLAAITLLTGCGSSSKHGQYINQAGMAGNYSDISSINSSVIYANKDDADYFKNISLGDTMSDYSYDYKANGAVDSKEEVLKIHEKIEDYISDKDAYIEYLNNSFRMDEDNSNPDYSATGSLKFKLEIEEKEVENIINLLNDFCDNNGFRVYVYNQNVKNYDKFEIVDDDSSVNKITKDDLEKMLHYSNISIEFDYHIDRPFYQKAGISISNAFESFFENNDDFLSVLIGIVIIAFAVLFVVIIGSGIYAKAFYKRRLKHPEWYPAKEVKIVDK